MANCYKLGKHANWTSKGLPRRINSKVISLSTAAWLEADRFVYAQLDNFATFFLYFREAKMRSKGINTSAELVFIDETTNS